MREEASDHGLTPQQLENAEKEAARVTEALDAIPEQLLQRHVYGAERYAVNKVTVPLGSSGNVTVARFTIDEREATWAALRAAISGSQRGRGVVFPGTYTKLLIDGIMVMSDTPDEIDDHLEVISRTQKLRGGRVLIHGLGLGMVLVACLRNPAIEHVDVVELNEDVIRLVAPHYACDRLTVHHGNALAYRWPRGMRWDVVWHDIWNTISPDNLPDMHRLHRRFGGRCGWQGSWCRWMCE